MVEVTREDPIGEVTKDVSDLSAGFEEGTTTIKVALGLLATRSTLTLEVDSVSVQTKKKSKICWRI